MYTNHSFTLLKFLIVQNFKFLNDLSLISFKPVLSGHLSVKQSVKSLLLKYYSYSVACSGVSRGAFRGTGPPPHPHFKTKPEARGAEKNFFPDRVSSLSQALDDRPPWNRGYGLLGNNGSV